MAKKLLAVLIAVMMVVPMILVPASADSYTYTAVIRYDSDVGHGYSQIDGNSYPTTAYHLMSRIVLNYGDVGTESGHGSISWVNGNPNSAYGYDFATEKLFVALTGWNGQVSDTSNFLATADYTLEEGEYYQFDWYVSATEIKGYVNGELEIDYVGSDLWVAGGYIISYPNLCGYDILDTTVVAQDGSATYCPSVAQWSFSGALWGSADGGYTIVTDGIDYTVERYEIVDWTPYAQAVEAKIDAIGTVAYNSDVTEQFAGRRWDATNGGWGALFWINNIYGEDAPAPFELAFDVQFIAPASNDGAYWGGHLTNTYLGYSWADGKFIVGNHTDSANGPGSIDQILAASDPFVPDTTRLYHVELVFAADHVAVIVDGDTVVSYAGRAFSAGHRMSFFPYNNPSNVAKFQMIRLSDGFVINDNDFSSVPTNQGGTCVELTFTATSRKDSGEAIAAARAAYDAANDPTKALVSNYQTLVDAEAAYAAAIAAVAQSEADNVIALIDAIGTVTVDSLAAIKAAEAAYANVAPAVQALVTNYRTLINARAAYDSMVANIADVTAMIDSIGTVYYNTATNRETDYDNTGFLGHFTGDNGYSNQRYNGNTALSIDYEMEFDFQIVSFVEGQNAAQLAGGADGAFVIGYDFATSSFTVNSGNPWTNLDPEEDIGIGATEMTLNPDLVYHWKLHAAGNRVTLEIDGVKVAEVNGGTAENPIRKDGQYFIFYPKYCDVKFANYTFSVNAGSGYAPVEANLNGAALIASTTWDGRSTGYGTDVVALHADAILDDGALIAACEDAYAALSAYEKTQIANYATLTAARATYNELANAEPPHVHNYTAVVTPPTCTEAGYTTYTCECGDSYVADEVPATGHNFVDGFCTVCGAADPDYVPPVAVILGDVNGDEEVNTKDITLLRRFIANYDDETGTSTVEVAAGADFNEDGSVNTKDLTALRRFIANME